MHKVAIVKTCLFHNITLQCWTWKQLIGIGNTRGDQLISCPLPGDDQLFVGRYRYCRSGRYRPPPSLPRPPDRHSKPNGRNLNFAFVNIRALSNKLDSLIDICHDHNTDETWHDSDSVCVRRLRTDHGCQVVDRPRPRTCWESLTTNHGGVAAVAFNGVHLTKLDLGVQSTTFEHVCVRVTAGTSSCVAAVIYRPGSESVKEQFFTEFRHMMDHLATFVDPIFVIGDLNIRLDRPSDPHAITLVDDLASYGFTNRVTSATHVAGGMLDVVITRDDVPPPCVNVVDADLSVIPAVLASTAGSSMSVIHDSNEPSVEAFRSGFVSFEATIVATVLS